MWPFDYFKKKREKAEREHLRQEEARLRKLEQERIAREKARQIEENRCRERLRAEREQIEALQPFSFKSNCHQRYENGSPVKG